jgi:hypothetical protein
VSTDDVLLAHIAVQRARVAVPYKYVGICDLSKAWALRNHSWSAIDVGITVLTTVLRGH